MLSGQRLAVNAGDHQRQRVHRFVTPQALEIRPGVVRHPGHPGRLVGPVERLETDKSGFRLRRNFLHQFAELKTRPRHNHRPRFNTAHPVNALFQAEHPRQLHRFHRHRLLHQPADLNRPGCRDEPVHVAINVLAQGELVKIVVSAGDLFIGERPVRIELVVARRRIGSGRRRGVGGAVGCVVGSRRSCSGAARQRRRQQTRRRAAHLPEKTASVQEGRGRCHSPLGDAPVRMNDDVGHAVKMPEQTV